MPGRPTPSLPARFCASACLAALALSGWCNDSRAQPFALERPEFLREPTVSRTITGITYSYLGSTVRRAARLQITLVEVPAATPDADAATCAAAFLGTIRQQHEGFLALRDTAPLHVGARVFDTWRWSGRHGQEFLTGVVACRREGDRFLAITFQDALDTAPDTFVSIKSRIQSMEFK